MTTKKNLAVVEDNKQLQEADDLYADLLAQSDLATQYGQDDIKLPHIKLLQSNSPEVKLKPSDQKYNPAFRAGVYFNTVTGEVADSLLIVPVSCSTSYVEWNDRANGKKGMVKDYGNNKAVLDKCTRDDRGRYWTGKTPNTLIVPTHYQLFYVLTPNGDSFVFEPALYPMSGAALNESKNWNTLKIGQQVNGKRLPDWACVYSLSSQTKTSQNSGDTYEAPLITAKGRLPDVLPIAVAKQIVAAAAELAKSVQERGVAVDHNATADEEGGGDNIPF